MPPPPLAVARRGQQPVDQVARKHPARCRATKLVDLFGASAASPSNRRWRGESAFACRLRAQASSLFASSLLKMKRIDIVAYPALVAYGRVSPATVAFSKTRSSAAASDALSAGQPAWTRPREPKLRIPLRPPAASGFPGGIFRFLSVYRIARIRRLRSGSPGWTIAPGVSTLPDALRRIEAAVRPEGTPSTRCGTRSIAQPIPAGSSSRRRRHRYPAR